MHICSVFSSWRLSNVQRGLLNKCKEMPVYVLVYAVLLSFNIDEEIRLVTVGDHWPNIIRFLALGFDRFFSITDVVEGFFF